MLHGEQTVPLEGKGSLVGDLRVEFDLVQKVQAGWKNQSDRTLAISDRYSGDTIEGVLYATEQGSLRAHQLVYKQQKSEMMHVGAHLHSWVHTVLVNAEVWTSIRTCPFFTVRVRESADLCLLLQV